MASNHRRNVCSQPTSTLASGLAASLLLACAGTALAQPTGVTVTDLGNFASSSAVNESQFVTITAAAPVAWFKIGLPRIFAPHRFLDISTSGSGTVDTEIAMFTASGLLVGSDDDDGASNFSALSFGLTDPNAPSRVPPIVEPGQAPGVANDGRDGSFTANPLTGTAADYYIAVTQYNVNFANGFGVTRLNGPATGLNTRLTLRMGTPSGQQAPEVNGTSRFVLTNDTSVSPAAITSLGVVSVVVDVSSLGGSNSAELNGSANDDQWSGTVPLGPGPLPVGSFSMTYRATNSIGDVSIDGESIFVQTPGRRCIDADQQTIPSTPGTTIRTYNTTDGGVDGPWTTACFNPTFTPTGNDVWFRFVPTQNGTLSLSTCNGDTGFAGAQPDTLLGLRGQCSAGNPFLVCGDDVGGCGVGTRLTNIPVTAGQQYNIAVRAFSTDIVNGRLAVTFTPTACTASDVAGAGGSVGPDGELTADDIIRFVAWFTTGDSRADIARSGGLASPDGELTADDIILFIARFTVGC